MSYRKFIIAAWCVAVVINLFAFDSFAQKKKNQAKKAAEKPLPNLILNTVKGAEWSLESERGGIVLLNFWATWCAPCRSEIPILVRLSDDYKADGVKIVGVSVDSENVGQIEKFIADYKISYTNVLANPGSLLSQQKALPMSLLIDRKGVLAKKYVGAISEDILRADIENLTGKKAAVNKQTTDKRGLTILHTNDIHGHLSKWTGWEGDLKNKNVGGLDRLAAQVTKARNEVKAENVLLLDAGDTLGDTLVAAETEGRAVIETMNRIGYDAMVVGNHEPDFTVEKLLERIKEAKFPVLAANIVRKADDELFTKPYVIKTIGGVRVGILGVSYPNTPRTSAKKNVDNLTFREAVETAREYVPRLRKEGAEIVVALTHLGLNADKQLAEKVKGIDVIVGGHSHNRMTDAIRAGDTLIVQAGAHGSDLGRLDLTIENGRVTAFKRTLIPITNSESDKSVADVIEKQTAPFQTRLGETIGQAKSLIERAQTIAGGKPEKRDAESPADSLFADAIREETKTNIAFLPGLGYGVAIQPGAITIGELRNLIPHDSAIFTMKLSGAEIREVLEQAVENVFTDDMREKVGGMIQISGLRFSYDPNRVRGSRIIKVTVGEKPLDSKRTYPVAVNGLLAEGGHNQKTFLSGIEKSEVGKQFETVKKWIAAKKSVSVPPIGRIEKIKPQKKK